MTWGNSNASNIWGFHTKGIGFYQYDKSDIENDIITIDLGLNVNFNF